MTIKSFFLIATVTLFLIQCTCKQTIFLKRKYTEGVSSFSQYDAKNSFSSKSYSKKSINIAPYKLSSLRSRYGNEPYSIPTAYEISASSIGHTERLVTFDKANSSLRVNTWLNRTLKVTDWKKFYSQKTELGKISKTDEQKTRDSDKSNWKKFWKSCLFSLGYLLFCGLMIAFFTNFVFPGALPLWFTILGAIVLIALYVYLVIAWDIPLYSRLQHKWV